MDQDVLKDNVGINAGRDCTVHMFNGVVEFLFIIAVYLRIKDYSGMNIKKFNNDTHSFVWCVFKWQSDQSGKKTDDNILLIYIIKRYLRSSSNS